MRRPIFQQKKGCPNIRTALFALQRRHRSDRRTPAALRSSPLAEYFLQKTARREYPPKPAHENLRDRAGTPLATVLQLRENRKRLHRRRTHCRDRLHCRPTAAEHTAGTAPSTAEHTAETAPSTAERTAGIGSVRTLPTARPAERLRSLVPRSG